MAKLERLPVANHVESLRISHNRNICIGDGFYCENILAQVSDTVKDGSDFGAKDKWNRSQNSLNHDPVEDQYNYASGNGFIAPEPILE